MNQSFTGSSRKLRQVNLSGRNTSNPWAALSGAKSSGSQDPVAQAQADRAKRQQERDKLTASKKIQKLWRGHSSRRRQKTLWRDLWDEVEQKRLGLQPSHTTSDISWLRRDPLPYQEPGQLASQIRMFLAFQEFRGQRPRFQDDTARLVFLGQGIRQTLPSASQSNLDAEMASLLSRLGLVTARHLRSVTLPNNETAADSYGTSLLSILILLCQLVPQNMSLDARRYFEAIQPITHSQYGLFWREQLQDTITALLTSSPSSAPAAYTAYTAFTVTILSQNSFAACKGVLRNLAAVISIDALAKAIANQDFRMEKEGSSNLSPDQLLWQLAHFVHMHDTQKLDLDAQNSYIEGLSALVGQCAQEIAQRLDLVDSPMYGSDASTPRPLPPFVREIVSTIPQEKNVRDMLAVMGKTSSFPPRGSQQDFDAAKRLANYSLALLSAFPSKAQNIRMLLHQGTFSFIGGADVSIIQYFWTITRQTTIFQQISANHRMVLSLLREAAPPSSQIGQAPLTKAEIAKWRDEWKITILFFELYGFILKLMDDSEFFSLGKTQTFGTNAPATSLIGRKGALPLTDVASMLTFLKNFAFSLYWYAADLVEASEVEETTDISALFGKSTHPVPQQPKSTVKQLENLTGNGVSQAYLKGLVTGLLRQLHEIDSRQAFAHPSDWLMTEQVNMTGFISAVVNEEEKRHELVDEDEQDGQEGDDVPENLGDLNDSFNSNRTSTLLSNVFGIRQPHVPRSRDSRQTEFLERWAMKARRKRQIESLAPRLEILRNLPFFIPFETRVQIFREFIYRDQVRRRGGAVEPESWRLTVGMTTQGRGPDGQPLGADILSRHHAEIRRDNTFEDAYYHFYQLGEGLKEPIQITFIDQFGAPEAGIDGGGVTKEFLMSVTKDALDPNLHHAMFKETPQQSLYPNPLLYDETVRYYARTGTAPKTDDFTSSLSIFLRRFQFLGRIIGKCLYEGILIDVSFAGFFLLKWALTGGSTVGSNESAYRPTINDLREYDEELYQGLLKLKNYPGDVEADFGLDFTVTDTLERLEDKHKPTETITTELKPNGANIPVTNANRLEYINRVVHRKLIGQPKTVTDFFLSGLGQIIQPSWLAMFNQKELQKLVGGDSSELDIADLRNNTQYGGLYVVGDDGQEHPTVQLFWKALQEMSDDDRRKVLKFVTSTPRAPLLGFGHLNPKFSIRDSSEDQARLPSTSTCVNLLKLPRYGDYKTMKEKLLYAVNSGAGFDLS